MKLIRERCCCFTGHRYLSRGESQALTALVEGEIRRLYRDGTDIFLAGGAMGFDTLAARAVLRLRARELPDLRLVLVLPCLGQEKLWPASAAALYHEILRQADEVIYTDDLYSREAMLTRNRYLVDHSGTCVCFLRPGTVRGGTLYTVRYAQGQGLPVRNLAGEGLSPPPPGPCADGE